MAREVRVDQNQVEMAKMARVDHIMVGKKRLRLSKRVIIYLKCDKELTQYDAICIQNTWLPKAKCTTLCMFFKIVITAV